MVEQRSLPADRDAHFRYDGVNAYAVVRLDTDSEDDSLSDQLAEPMIGLAMATRGSDVPQWFSEGVARAIVNTRVRRLDRATKRALRIQFLEAAAATKDAKQFLEGRLQAEQLEAIATAIGSFVTDSSQKAAFSSLVRSLNSGEPFDASFAKSFGGSTEAFVDAYLKTVNGGAN